MRYILGSGFFARTNESQSFTHIWAANVERFARPAPERIVIMAVGGSSPEKVPANCDVIRLQGNLGHVDDLCGDPPPKTHKLCGWSGAMLALALIAYNNESDLIFQEQDCLAFGPYVEQMYSDLGDGEIVFGGPMVNPPRMPCAQGLFLVRHSFIPTLVERYLSFGNDGLILPEHKFTWLRAGSRGLSFGYDRERPFNTRDPVFYVQQLTPDEMIGLWTERLI